MYARMPFGLINVGATFQRAMDISFVGEKYNFIVIYLDDIIFFQKQMRNKLNICISLLRNAENMVYP